MSATATVEQPRRLTPTRVIIAAIIATIGLLLTAFSVFAGLNAVANNPVAQGVSSGTLSLTMSANGAGFSSAISNMAPGDVVNRYVALTSGGTLATKLTTDSANGLQVTVKSCSVAWNATAGTCGGTTTTLLASSPISGLTSAAPGSLVTGAIASNTTYNLQVSTQLPNQSETTTNGTFPANTIQGLTANLTWNFTEAQRTATTTNS